jgi:ABC-2 type transport system permease protein
MRNLYAIYRKEIAHYFASPIAYIVIAIFLVVAGFFFNVYLSAVIRESFEQSMQAMQYGGAQNFDVPGVVMRAYLGLLGTLLLFLLPGLSMGVYSEERKRGTIELLMTSPITDTQIVLGKYLASLTLFALMIVPTAGYQIFMLSRSEPAPPWKILLAGYIGLFLLGASLLALGSFLSSLTENQLIAFVLTFSIFLLLWVIDFGGNGTGSASGSFLQYLSVVRHYDDFTRGVLDTSSLIYYGSWIFFGMFLTVRSLDSLRWRRA